MGLTRRQVLVGGGAIVGLGLAAAAQQTRLAYQSGTTSMPVATASLTTAKTAKTAIAPQGLFAPVRGDVRLAVISDLNSQYGSTDYEPEVDQAIKLIPDWQPDIVLGGGDMVAGMSPSLSRAEIQAMWDGFDRHVAAPLRQANLPFGFTIGNHDASGARASNGKFLFPDDRDLAAAYWNDPRHNPGLTFVDRANFPFHYSFQHQEIFYLVWDASTSQIPPEQLRWAEQVLQSDKARQAKLRIAIGHLPLYAVAVGRDDPGEVLAEGDRLADFLEQQGVHTYISGHHHAYFPGHHGRLELLHTSALGSGPRPLLNSSLAPFKTLTIVDIDTAAATTRYTTYNMQTLQVVDHQTLPRFIVGPTGRVLRLDVQNADLTPEERQRTYQPA